MRLSKYSNRNKIASEGAQKIDKNDERKNEIVERGFNQEIYDKVEEMIKFSGKYVEDNKEKIAETIMSRAGDDEKTIYEALLKVVNNEINRVEKRFEISSSCQKGCAACCYQPIYITEIEADFIIQEIQKMSDKDKENVRVQAKNIMAQIRKKNIPYKLSPKDDENKNDLEYLQLKLKCPLLNEKNECMTYNVRPQACYIYRNYGNPKDCIDEIAPHSYNYQEYSKIGIPVVQAIAISSGKINKDEPSFTLLAKYICDKL